MSSELSLATDITPRELDGELVLLDLGGGTVYHLNETGAFIWKRLAAGSPLASVASKITDEFEVDADQARQDVQDFVDALCNAGLAAPTNAVPQSCTEVS